jgi:hypothetical protein
MLKVHRVFRHQIYRHIQENIMTPVKLTAKDIYSAFSLACLEVTNGPALCRFLDLYSKALARFPELASLELVDGFLRLSYKIYSKENFMALPEGDVFQRLHSALCKTAEVQPNFILQSLSFHCRLEEIAEGKEAWRGCGPQAQQQAQRALDKISNGPLIDRKYATVVFSAPPNSALIMESLPLYEKRLIAVESNLDTHALNDVPHKSAVPALVPFLWLAENNPKAIKDASKNLIQGIRDKSGTSDDCNAMKAHWLANDILATLDETALHPNTRYLHKINSRLRYLQSQSPAA